MTTDTDILTEYVRQALARQITNQYVIPGEPLKVITLSGKVEKTIADAVQQTEYGSYLSLDPERSQSIIEAIAAQLEQHPFANQTPILLCSPAVRMYVRQLTERHFPNLPILSYNELEANVEVQSVGMVDIA
jgi:flagellar biosynthesis protein FlhA